MSITNEREFADPYNSFEWTTDGVKPPGGSETVIYVDEETGTHCRFLHLPEGFQGGKEPLEHDFDEIVFIVSGEMINDRLNERYRAGTVAVFPKGTKHGPMSAPKGAYTLEFRHYRKK
jgi:mannose-6-phosphate isomerase-like protein (cupin superfamily)